jgi:sulfide:quinone oxidoreductase
VAEFREALIKILSFLQCRYLTITKHILILGAGFGGLASANLLRKSLPRDHQITVIEKSPYFLMGLVNLWMSGTTNLEDSQVASNRLENKGIRFLNDEIISVDLSKNSAYYLLMPL